MPLRLFTFLFACAFLAAVEMGCHTTTIQMPPGLVLVAKVRGTVTMTVAGTTTELSLDDRVPQPATINTGQDSIAVLVFSNGATLQLGADTELGLEKFLQEPFSSTITLSQLKDEPSTSRTTLALNRGDFVGNITMLKIAKGSSFIVQTPVGTADVLGGTFRAVFRAEGVNQFLFSLSNIGGKVHFTQPTGHGAASGAGKAVVVPPGQEIKFTVGVSQNSQGQNEMSPLPNAAAPRPPADQERIIPPTVATPRK